MRDVMGNHLNTIITELKNAPRLGAAEDKPEGARFILVSDTLMTELITELERIANERYWRQ